MQLRWFFVFSLAGLIGSAACGSDGDIDHAAEVAQIAYPNTGAAAAKFNTVRDKPAQRGLHVPVVTT